LDVKIYFTRKFQFFLVNLVASKKFFCLGCRSQEDISNNRYLFDDKQWKTRAQSMNSKKTIKTQKRWAFLFYEQLNIDKEQIESIRGEWLEFIRKE